MKTIHLLELGLGAVLSFSAACGGGSPPPPKPEPAPSAVDTAPVPAEAASAAPSASASSAAPEPPAPAASSQASSEAAENDADDACSKSAIPYEEKVRPLFNACYQAGKKKNPDLQGQIKITLTVSMTGKVTSTKPDASELGGQVVDCMVKAVKKTPFDGKDCKGKSVTVSKVYGKPGAAL